MSAWIFTQDHRRRGKRLGNAQCKPGWKHSGDGSRRAREACSSLHAHPWADHDARKSSSLNSLTPASRPIRPWCCEPVLRLNPEPHEHQASSPSVASTTKHDAWPRRPRAPRRASFLDLWTPRPGHDARRLARASQHLALVRRGRSDGRDDVHALHGRFLSRQIGRASCRERVYVLV